MTNGNLNLKSGPVDPATLKTVVDGPILDFHLTKSVGGNGGNGGGNEVPYVPYSPPANGGSNLPYSGSGKGTYTPYQKTILPPVAGMLDKPVLCFDLETSGLQPWEYQILVVSFWPLEEPKSSIVTFAGFDEEKLITDVATYLGSYEEYDLTGFNMGFDCRALLSRFMAYQIALPSWFTAEFYDTRELLRKGVWSFLTSDQQTGTLEQWATYLYDEQKPYTIEECMNAVLNNDLQPYILRNRWDVAIEGDIFLLAKYVETGQLLGTGTPKPAMEQRDEAQESGIVVTKCPTCQSVNEFDLKNLQQKCFVCGAIIQRPISEAWLREIVRPLNVEAVK